MSAQAAPDPNSSARATESAERVLEVDNLQTFFYTRAGLVKAVDGVSFTLGRGATLAIVGESGCGKSVTALSLMRLVADPPGRIVGGSVRLDGVDLISLGPTDLSTALGISDPKDPRLRQTVEELVAKINRIGKAKVYLPVYHAAFYLTPQELVQMGVSYTSVAPPPPTIVLNALRESAQRIREQAQQRGQAKKVGA